MWYGDGAMAEGMVIPLRIIGAADLPGIKPESPAFQADSLLSELPGKPIIIYGRCIFDFIRNCQTFSQILNYCTFPLAVCDVLISLHPSQYLVW